MSYIHFIGIDVSKEWVDVALHGSTVRMPLTPASLPATLITYQSVIKVV